MSHSMVLSEEQLYKLISFLVTSAHLCIVEPDTYGPFRLVDAASRLIGFALESGQVREEQLLRQLKLELDGKKHLHKTGGDAYGEFLESVIGELVKHRKSTASS